MTGQFYFGLFLGLSVAAVFAYAAWLTFKRNQKLRESALQRELVHVKDQLHEEAMERLRRDDYWD